MAINTSATWVVTAARDPQGISEHYGVNIITEDGDLIAHLTGADAVEHADYIIDCVQFCAGYTYQEFQALGSLKALVAAV